MSSLATATATEPMAGVIVSLLIIISAISALSSFMTQRYLAITTWRKLPVVVWLTLAIYVDSWLFIVIAAVVRFGAGMESSFGMCATAIYVCLVFYLGTKLLYLFLAEKAFIVWSSSKRRLRSKLYLFNTFGMLAVFLGIGILNFVYRIARFDQGFCVIGMERMAIIPLISFDLVANVYLTILFLIPLQKMHSFRSKAKVSGSHTQLRTIAMRTFVGALCTTLSSVVNISTLTVLDGEPGWICLMCCNIDVLFTALVVHWVTSRDHAGSNTTERDRSEATGARSVAVERSVVIQHSRADESFPGTRRDRDSIELTAPQQGDTSVADTKNTSWHKETDLGHFTSRHEHKNESMEELRAPSSSSRGIGDDGFSEISRSSFDVKRSDSALGNHVHVEASPKPGAKSSRR